MINPSGESSDTDYEEIPSLEIPPKEFNEMSYEETALDWITRLANSTNLDTDPSILSDAGFRELKRIRAEHRDYYEDHASISIEERCRREEELSAAERLVTVDDPGVVEKNRFLALLADQFDGTALADRLGVDRFSEEGKRLRVLTNFVSSSSFDLLVSLRRYAETCGGARDYMLQQQFLGLWAIYQAGKEPVDQDPLSDQ